MYMFFAMERYKLKKDVMATLPDRSPIPFAEWGDNKPGGGGEGGTLYTPATKSHTERGLVYGLTPVPFAHES